MRSTTPLARITYLSCLALLLAGILWGEGAHAADEIPPSVNVYSFGVVPQHTATVLARRWTPFLNYLSEKTGYRINFKTAKDIPTFEERLAAGEYDFAYMNPYHYIVAHRNVGYQVYAKEKDRLLRGVLVVRADNPYRHVRELQNQSLAFPAPAAFAASLLTRAHLDKLGVAYTPVYVSSHDSVYYGVGKGLFVGGGGIPFTLEKLTPENRRQLRTLWVSPTYTPHAIAAHPRVAAKAVHRILHAMERIHVDTRGRRLLGALGFKGLVRASDQDYDDVRRLGPQIRRILAHKNQ